MAAGSPLLALPMEMLQHISSFASSTDLIALCLSCRTLEVASFNAFADHYMRELSCYFMQPRRLLRLYNIAASPRLLKTVEQVTFTADAWEGKDVEDISACSSHENEPLCLAQRAFFVSERERLYDMYHAEGPPTKLMNEVLQRLEIAKCRICIDLGDHNLSQGYRMIGHDVLEALCNSQCRLHTVNLFGDSIEGLDRLLLRSKRRCLELMAPLQDLHLTIHQTLICRRRLSSKLGPSLPFSRR